VRVGGSRSSSVVSNALKHAFPGDRSGTIRVTARREGAVLSVRVADDGVGVADEVDLSSPKRMGFRLVRTLAAQIAGELVVERGPGTAVVLRIAQR
jgi:two-component sensor histidine kinase